MSTEKKGRALYYVYEITSLGFAFGVVGFMIWYALYPETRMFDGIALFGVDFGHYEHVLVPLWLYGATTLFSVGAGREKLVIIEESDPGFFYDQKHRFCVSGIHGIISVAMLVVALGKLDWVTLGAVAIAGFVYGFFKWVVIVRPHTFGARLRSVIVVRVMIAGTLIYQLPPSKLKWVCTLIIVLAVAAAVARLNQHRKKFNWLWR